MLFCFYGRIALIDMKDIIQVYLLLKLGGHLKLVNNLQKYYLINS
jgi:hypothetical protein